MRPTLRKTPYITRKVPGSEPERLVLNEDTESVPLIAKGPKFSLSRNKKPEGDEKAKNVYAALNDIKKDEGEQLKLKVEEPPPSGNKTTLVRPDFKLRKNLKENNVELEKHEDLPGQIRKDASHERIPDKPTLDLEESVQGGRMKRPKRIIKKPEDSPFAPQNDFLNRPQDGNKVDQSIYKQEQYNKADIPPSVPRPEYKLNLDDLETREVDLTEETKPLNLQKQQKQLSRVRNLSKLINLQMDIYEPMLNLQSVTEYQLYISKIKSGAVNNSLSQAFDDTADKACQQDFQETFDFSNQTPDDKKTTYIRGLETSSNSSLSLFSLISKAVPVIEELLRPSKSFSMPPIELLSLSPILVGLHITPLPISLYQCNDLSLVLVGQKLYVSRGEITSVLVMGSLFLAGTSEGSLLLWSGRTEKSKFYDAVKLALGEADFELPACSSDYLQRESYFKGSARVVGLKQKHGSQFCSLEEFGKLITWSIVTKSSPQGKVQYSLQPLSYISLGTLYSDGNLLCYNMFKDPSQQPQQDKKGDSKSKYFVTCSKGIVKNVPETGSPNFFNTNSRVIDMVVTIRGNLLYVICADNCLKIFDKDTSQALYSLLVPSLHQLQSILIPSIILDQGKQLELLSEVLVTDTKGQVFRYNILSSNDPVQTISHQMCSDKTLLKASVSLSEDKIELMFVTRELRTVYTSQKVEINTGRNTQNYKRIIEEDKKVIEYLNSLI